MANENDADESFDLDYDDLDFKPTRQVQVIPWSGEVVDSEEEFGETRRVFVDPSTGQIYDDPKMAQKIAQQALSTNGEDNDSQEQLESDFVIESEKQSVTQHPLFTTEDEHAQTTRMNYNPATGELEPNAEEDLSSQIMLPEHSSTSYADDDYTDSMETLPNALSEWSCPDEHIEYHELTQVKRPRLRTRVILIVASIAMVLGISAGCIVSLLLNR